MTQPTPLPHSTPEAQGIASSAIQAFFDAAERDIQHLHSLMLLRHGHVVAEGWWQPYEPASPHMLFSLSKSFTSTAVGQLVAEGRLSVDDLVLPYFPDERPAQPSTNLQAMRVKHLLTMTAGHATDPTRAVFGEPDWARAFLAQPVEHEPGTFFVYNTAATYMLSAIVQRVTGLRVVEYLRPRLFEPLGIADATWETSPQGVDVGGSGLSLTTEAIARFGQLYLQKGVWQGQRLIPEAWVEAGTARQVPNGPSQNPDWEQGYGYQFWRCRHGAYRGDGAFGQFCVVMPAQDAVLAITSGLRNMQSVLDLVWEHVLPALGSAPLAADPAAERALTERLAALRLPTPKGERISAVANEVSGKTFTLDDNEYGIRAVTFDFGADGSALTIRRETGEQRIVRGYGAWAKGEADLALWAPRERRRAVPGASQVAAGGAWADERTYVVQLWWYETPFGRTLTCRFEGERVVINAQGTVGFGPQEERPPLTGRAG